ncbi:hypothetical protein M2156_002025 [Streptomyces sp. SAI-149]|nr:hypothetical protein [Streptomyces sp. SAI-119]MDH6495806.1 hypothetical protein [Streptomyces sp. SAI-149]
MERNVVWLIAWNRSNGSDGGNAKISAHIRNVWNTTRKVLRMTAGLLTSGPRRGQVRPASEVAVVTDGDNGPADRAEYTVALERVRLVIAWYTRTIQSERRAAPPDRQRLAELMAARQQCVADQRALDTADEAHIARVAAAYGARYRSLRGADNNS